MWTNDQFEKPWKNISSLNDLDQSQNLEQTCL